MYIRHKLIKKLNEEYFRNCTHNKNLFKLDNDIDSSTITKILKTNNQSLYYEYLNDLYKELLGRRDFDTIFAKEMNNIVNHLSNKIKYDILKQSNITKETINILRENSKNSYLVGGYVRDTLSNKVSKDFDFVTDIDYDKLTKIFKENGYIVKETGKEFLVMIVTKEQETLEIANFRKDGMYADGRRPESVEIGDMFTDSDRRDFTINSIYYNLDEEIVVDPTGMGIDDILLGTLRFVGKPKDRIKEDYLRGWRFIRFMDKGYKADKKSLKAVLSNWDEIYTKSNPHRVLLEINRIIGLF